MVTWKEKVVCRILFIIAMMMAEDSKVHDEIKALATHISVEKNFA